MMRLPKLSLRVKFIVPLVIFTIFITASISYVAVQRFYIELEDQLFVRALELSTVWIKERWGGGSSSSSPLIPYAEVRHFQIVEQGTVTYSTFVSVPPGFDDVLPMPVENSRRPVRIDDVDLLEVIRVPDPGLLSGDELETANYVRMYLSLDKVNAAVQSAIRTISIFAVISILFGSLIIIWLFRGIIGPIENLTSSVKKFKHDMQVRSSIKTGDELETMGNEFNRMANTIQERDEHLEDMNAELTKANEVKSEFLAVMGHELKTPIHGIRGYAQLMLEEIDGPITESQRKDLENIMESGDHLRVLIDNILQFSKLESGKEKLHPHEVEVQELVAEAIKNVSVIARQKGIELESNVNGVRVNADETKLKQVLINLLGNALKYTDEGSVSVTAEERPGELIFSVADTGVGIPREMYEQVFEPFTQIDSSTTRKWGGIGLGLSIVKKYIEMHGGRIWIESNINQGTTFYFTIPTAKTLSEVQN